MIRNDIAKRSRGRPDHGVARRIALVALSALVLLGALPTHASALDARRPLSTALGSAVAVQSVLGRSAGFAVPPSLAGLPDGLPLIVVAAHLIPGDGTATVYASVGEPLAARALRVDRDLGVAVLQLECADGSSCPPVPISSFAAEGAVPAGTPLVATGVPLDPSLAPELSAGPGQVLGEVAPRLLEVELGLPAESSAGPIFNEAGDVTGLVVYAPLALAERSAAPRSELAVSATAIQDVLANVPPIELAGDRAQHILPILDGQPPTPERVRALLASLGRGGPRTRVGFSGVYRYMADVDPTLDYQIVPTRLEEIAATARKTRTPFLVNLNGSRWAGGGPLLTRLSQERSAMAWSADDVAWSWTPDGEWHFSLSAYNFTYRMYKERNLRAAAAWLAAFAAGPDGDLLVGVSTDAEVLLNLHPGYDYNPLVLDEFRDWLAGTGVYGPGNRWEADAQNLTLEDVNERFDTEFTRWARVKPPRKISEEAKIWRAWRTFRNLLVDHSVQEQVDWMRDSGIPAERIFTHQTPGLDLEVFADSLASAQVDGGNAGVTLYHPHAVDTELLARVQALGTRWAVMEYDPQGVDQADDLSRIELLNSFGPSVLCPYHWDNQGGPNESLSTIMGTPFEGALRTFVLRHRAGEPAETGASTNGSGTVSIQPKDAQ